LISLVILSSNTFSQTGTNNKDSVVILPTRIARQVVKDLVAYDGVKLELIKTQLLIVNLENQLLIQSSIIQQYEIKDGHWKQMTNDYDLQSTAYKNMTNTLQKDLRKAKVKEFYTKLGFTIGLTALTYLYITK